MTKARISPGGFFDLGPINWILCRLISLGAGAKDAHLFSTLARQRSLFRGWLSFASRMMPGGTISRHETELVILRVAHVRQCQYELDHHVRIGRRVGVTDDVLERIFAGPEAHGWSDRHRALLAAVDSLLTTKNIDDAGWDALRRHYDEAQSVELCLLVGHYDMLAMTIATLRIARDF
ncbi:MAG: carboxymuconolactone decarboxylase family protein [Polyangiaceae bacterium]|nr:carboxymuconolactone decarboxylase family protein [Polyangiaceae bacterium]